MIHQDFLLRMSWPQRIVVALAGATLGLAMLILFRLLDPIDLSTSGSIETSPWFYTAALGFLLLGAIIIIVETGRKRAAWIAGGASLLGLASAISEPFGFGCGVDTWIANFFPGDVAINPESMPFIVALPLIFGGILVLWMVIARHESRRILCFALLGSLMGGVGITTLLGYALKMSAVCRWGSHTGLPPSVTLLMLTTGFTLLAIAWREHHAKHTGAPAWLPVPVVATCGMFTLIFWIGLRERETVYFGTNTQIAINNFASAISLDFERQAAALERIGRRWTDPDMNAVWESDAVTWMQDAPGARSLARIAPDGATSWYYPMPGNEALIAFNQFSQPDRRQTFEIVLRTKSPVVSNSLELPGRGQGFIICAPIYHAATLVGFITAEFTYQQFFAKIDQRAKASLHHNCEIYIGDKHVYDSLPNLEDAGNDPRALASIFTLQNRRLRIIMAPTGEYLQTNRRYLPELALATGLGITFLLGLSVHLARKARASLFAAESSNRLLSTENEERRRVEMMLTISDERLRLALDATAISTFEWNLATNELLHSASLWTLLGTSPEQTSSTVVEWERMIHPDDLANYRAAVALQLSGASVFIDPEYRVRAGDGEWRWLYARSKTVAYGAAGEPTRIVGTLQDVTERKKAEHALRLSQASSRKLSLVASRTDNFVLISAPDGSIEWVNESFQRVMEYPLDEIMGKKPSDFMFGPETDPQTVKLLKTAFIRGEGLSTDIINYSKSGRKHHLQLELQPVYNEKGELENFIAIEADITVRIETEQALRRAKAEADATSRAKSEFLASVSHEIRTPMNGVIGMTNLLLETPLNHDQRDTVNTIRASGEALLSIINDILDFSKIESGKLELEHQPFDLVNVIEETLDLFATQAATRQIEVDYFIDEKVPKNLIGDAGRLRQVLSNLVNNAIKFTAKGSISVEVSPARSKETMRLGHRMIAIAVRDTGIGIPADRINRLFKPFSQVDSSTTRKYGGTGLGLVICQRLCMLMGGDIRVESDIRNGSTFIVTLQVEPATPDNILPAQPLPAALGKGPVLCIDDNAVTLRRLTAFFHEAGIETLTATASDAAIALLQCPAPPVAALLDMELTVGTNGANIHEELRRLKIPTIGLCLIGSTSQPLRENASPFTSVNKPLNTQSLIRAFHALFPGTASPTSTIKINDLAKLSEEFPIDILLVEDNPVNQKVALRFLERLGYKADTTANGVEAITALTAHPYHLVFMDLQMPEMDGFEATRRIRKLFHIARQPRIVALTANALQSDRDQCLAAGMNGFLTKPIKLAELADSIRRQFSKSQV